jgi:hypothetical protein
MSSMAAVAVVLLAVQAPAPQDAGWYEFRPEGDTGPSVVGMEAWQDRPAGAKGRIAREGDQLVQGGQPIKLWGVNLCYAQTAPEKTLAGRRAAFYAKFGINTVRLHKFADGSGWAGVLARNSCVAYDPAALDRLDYQVAKFKEAGIYLLLSSNFGTLSLGPDDRARIPYVNEFGEARDGMVRAPQGALYFSEELQALQIEQMATLLRHRNPHTGLTYADDPAIAFVEAVNEQSALFYTTMDALKKHPTLRSNASRLFCKWLTKRYPTDTALRDAWGRRAMDSFAGEGFPGPAESLTEGNIVPAGNPWFWDPDQLAGSQAYRKQRLLDTAVFLYDLEAAFYQKFVEGVRKAGYAGEIIGSNWQAGRGVSHLLNLLADRRVGTVDRHNYFGGGDASGKPFDASSMLWAAGSGPLSTGFQQVADRPFMLSEWNHVWPNEHGVEGPALVGAYGMGLQGWDVSYLFQNGDDGRLSAQIGRERWDAMAPQVAGIFPAVARQVRRGDVDESELEAVLKVFPERLAAGEVGYVDRTEQVGDRKVFGTDKVPAGALAVARCVVEFVDRDEPTPMFDLAPHRTGGFLVSSTRQLAWKEGKSPAYVLINTPGTQAVVGFATGEVCRLADVAIRPGSAYGAFYVTAPGPGEAIAGADRVIVTLIGKARNTGQKLSPEGDRLLARGEPPVRLEGLKADLDFGSRKVAAIRPLDHDGRRNDRVVMGNGTGRVSLDSGRDQTPYYEIEFEK